MGLYYGIKNTIPPNSQANSCLLAPFNYSVSTPEDSPRVTNQSTTLYQFSSETVRIGSSAKTVRTTTEKFSHESSLEQFSLQLVIQPQTTSDHFAGCNPAASLDYFDNLIRLFFQKSIHECVSSAASTLNAIDVPQRFSTRRCDCTHLLWKRSQ